MTKVRSQPYIGQDVKAQIGSRRPNINLSNLPNKEQLIKDNTKLRCKFDF